MRAKSVVIALLIGLPAAAQPAPPDDRQGWRECRECRTRFAALCGDGLGRAM
jgi:hypothetical protein